MTRLSLAFFSAASLCAVAGMVYGIVLAISQDFTTAPAHAHLNLVGWASLALMGTYYQLSGRGGRLGWTNFGLSTLGVVIMIPSLAVMLKGNPPMEKLVAVGSLLVFAGMLVFLFVVLSSWKTAKAA